MHSAGKWRYGVSNNISLHRILQMNILSKLSFLSSCFVFDCISMLCSSFFYSVCFVTGFFYFIFVYLPHFFFLWLVAVVAVAAWFSLLSSFIAALSFYLARIPILLRVFAAYCDTIFGWKGSCFSKKREKTRNEKNKKRVNEPSYVFHSLILRVSIWGKFFLQRFIPK